MQRYANPKCSDAVFLSMQILSPSRVLYDSHKKQMQDSYEIAVK